MPRGQREGHHARPLDRQDRAVHLQLRRPRPPEDRRVGRGEEQPGAQALAVDEGWGSGARLSYRRRESRGRRGGGYSSGVSRSQAKGPEPRGGRPAGRRGDQDGQGSAEMRALLLAGLALVGAGQATEDVWQITLKDGTIVWNLRLETLRRDTIVFRQNTKTLRYPLLQVDEMRLVRGGAHEIGPVAAEGRYDGAPNGTSDLVFQLTLLDLAERRHVVQEILRTRSAPPPR